jgi:D-alanyl-lipoteichoic acid acyltransferase DltB (MBOAT superfamily)
MPFPSLRYLLFLPTVFLLFLGVAERHRWLLLLAASLAFYAALDAPVLLLVLAAVTLSSYGFGWAIGAATDPRRCRRLTAGGILVNLAILAVMKYLPVLAQHWERLPGRTLVSVGVSYYVLQAIAYLVDVDLELEPPERHLGHFALYLAFFPKLLQGPIERAGDLLPQLKALRPPGRDQARAALFQIVRGLFLKVVLADRLRLLVDPVFAQVGAYAGPTLALAVYAFALQIYFDFAGYTDMALGAARLFGVRLTPNFDAPYLARSIPAFWRRWHISFSRWILDYLFKPLQFQWRDARAWGTSAALLVTFLLSGLWHGASGGFLVWGGLHGLYLAASVQYRPYQARWHQALGLGEGRLLAVGQRVLTFHLVCLAWVFFRAASLGEAWRVLAGLTHMTTGRAAGWDTLATRIREASESGSVVQELAVLGAGLALLAAGRAFASPERLRRFLAAPAWLRFPCYYLAVMGLVLFGYFSRPAFAYVRF